MHTFKCLAGFWSVVIASVGQFKKKEEAVFSLQMKQVLWKLLPLHWISSAWYTVFSQAAHLAPPPQLGILEKQQRNAVNNSTNGRLLLLEFLTWLVKLASGWIIDKLDSGLMPLQYFYLFIYLFCSIIFMFFFVNIKSQSVPVDYPTWVGCGFFFSFGETVVEIFSLNVGC